VVATTIAVARGRGRPPSAPSFSGQPVVPFDNPVGGSGKHRQWKQATQPAPRNGYTYGSAATRGAGVNMTLFPARRYDLEPRFAPRSAFPSSQLISFISRGEPPIFP